MKFKYYLSKISTYVALPILTTLSIVCLIAIINHSIDSKALLLLSALILILTCIANILVEKYIFKKSDNPVWLNIALCISCFFVSIYSSFFYINRFPIAITYASEQIKEVKDFYISLSFDLYYDPDYQKQIPTTMKEVEKIVLQEFDNPKVTIKYVSHENSNIGGWVSMLNRSVIYINTPKTNSLYYNTMTLAHELWHTKGVINEAHTNFAACKTLLESKNKYLNFVSTRFIIYFLEGGENSYYDCTQLIVQDYFLNLKG